MSSKTDRKDASYSPNFNLFLNLIFQMDHRTERSTEWEQFGQSVTDIRIFPHTSCSLGVYVCVHEEVESLYGHKIDRQSVDDGDGEEEWRKCPWNLEEIENKFLRADYWPFRWFRFIDFHWYRPRQMIADDIRLYANWRAAKYDARSVAYARNDTIGFSLLFYRYWQLQRNPAKIRIRIASNRSLDSYAQAKHRSCSCPSADK